MWRLWIKLSKRIFLTSWLLTLITQLLLLFSSFFHLSENLLNLLVEVLKETSESKVCVLGLVFSCYRLFVSPAQLWELCLSLRRHVIFRVVFDGKFPVSFLDLIFTCILVDFQNFVWIKLFLNLFRVVFFEEILFVFRNSILIEEALEDFMWISGLVSLHYDISLDWSQSSNVNSWRPEKSTGEEERIIEVKEMPEESSAHVL